MSSSQDFGGTGTAFVLSELRDLRKGMEAMDLVIRQAIDSVRADMKELSRHVDQSQFTTNTTQTQLELVQGEAKHIREDLESLKTAIHSEKIRNDSAWTGPKKVAMIIGSLGSIAVAILAILNFGPQLVRLLFGGP